VEQSKQQQWTTDIDLTKWIGKTVDVKLRSGIIRNGVNIHHRDGLDFNVRVGGTMYTQEGGYFESYKNSKDIVAIKLSI